MHKLYKYGKYVFEKSVKSYFIRIKWKTVVLVSRQVVVLHHIPDDGLNSEFLLFWLIHHVVIYWFSSPWRQHSDALLPHSDKFAVQISFGLCLFVFCFPRYSSFFQKKNLVDEWGWAAGSRVCPEFPRPMRISFITFWDGDQTDSTDVSATPKKCVSLVLGRKRNCTRKTGWVPEWSWIMFQSVQQLLVFYW